MMLFQKNADAASVDTFQVSTMSGSRDRPVAFGPGSIINGNDKDTYCSQKVMAFIIKQLP
jgi:hypothetical protein